jgi:heme/copper-type cytochrome/quinol oxidase subunit 1
VEQTALNGKGVIPMQIQALSFEQLVGTVAVILLLVGVYNTIMSAIKNAREEKRLKEQPVNTLEHTVDDHTKKLQNDHERITQLEESNRIIMRALMAVMSHEVNGNSTEKLQTSMDEIQKFLIER